MASNTQVQTLVDNYNKAKGEANELRKSHLAKKAEVRTLRQTLETLVEYGVVSESVFGTDDEDDKSEASDSE